MPTERIPCSNADCSYTILPTTAKVTGGLCMPCSKGSEFLTKESMAKSRGFELDEIEESDDDLLGKDYDLFEQKINNEFEREIKAIQQEFAKSWKLSDLLISFFTYKIKLDIDDIEEDICVDGSENDYDFTLVRQISIYYDGESDQMWQIRIPIKTKTKAISEAKWFDPGSIEEVRSYLSGLVDLDTEIKVLVTGSKI